MNDNDQLTDKELKEKILTERQTKTFKFRIGETLNQYLQKIADRHALSKSEVIRLVLIAELPPAIKNYCPPRETQLTDAEMVQIKDSIIKFSDEISSLRNNAEKVGNNINQIAKRLNQANKSNQLQHQNWSRELGLTNDYIHRLNVILEEVLDVWEQLSRIKPSTENKH